MTSSLNDPHSNDPLSMILTSRKVAAGSLPTCSPCPADKACVAGVHGSVCCNVLLCVCVCVCVSCACLAGE
jgi:hypothetical protein